MPKNTYGGYQFTVTITVDDDGDYWLPWEGWLIRIGEPIDDDKAARVRFDTVDNELGRKSLIKVGYIVDLIDEAQNKALENLEVAISYNNTSGYVPHGNLTREQATNIIKDMVIKIKKTQNDCAN